MEFDGKEGGVMRVTERANPPRTVVHRAIWITSFNV